MSYRQRDELDARRIETTRRIIEYCEREGLPYGTFIPDTSDADARAREREVGGFLRRMEEAQRRPGRSKLVFRAA